MAEEDERGCKRSQRCRRARHGAVARARRHQGLRYRRGLVRTEVCGSRQGQMRATMTLRMAARFMLFAAMIFGWLPAAPADDAPVPGLIGIPAGHDSDLKFYAADGSI